MTDSHITVVYKWTAQPGKLEELKSYLLENAAFKCEVAVIEVRRKAGDGSGLPEKQDMGRAWTMGQIVALVPLRHLNGNLGPKAKKTWEALSGFVGSEQQQFVRCVGQANSGVDVIWIPGGDRNADSDCGGARRTSAYACLSR